MMIETDNNHLIPSRKTCVNILIGGYLFDLSFRKMQSKCPKQPFRNKFALYITGSLKRVKT